LLNYASQLQFKSKDQSKYINIVARVSSGSYFEIGMVVYLVDYLLFEPFFQHLQNYPQIQEFNK
jgi:hypothetical protein